MPDEDDLEELREEKLQDMKQGKEEEDTKDEQQKQIKQLAAKYLTKDAQSRLGNIRAADPEKAEAIETQIVRLGRAGQIDKVTDEQLKEILKSLGNEKDSSIKFRR